MANFNFNKVMLGGRITADPELRQTTGGTAVCSFTIAVNRPYIKSEEQKADFISVIAWRKSAEFVSQYFKKGSSIFVIGRIEAREYTDRNGKKRNKTEVIAEEIKFIDSKKLAEESDVGYYRDTPTFDEISDIGDLPF